MTPVPAACSDSKPKAAAIEPQIGAICRFAESHGLPSSVLDSLFDLIRSPTLIEQGSQNSLLNCMYPAEKIPEHVVYGIVSSLGPGKQKATSTTQQGLLKWILLVYDFLESPSVLFRLYGVLFNLLDVFYLRTHLCHLLAKITRRRHVKRYRIETLKRLERGMTTDSHLIKLVNVFESLAPGTFDAQLRKRNVSFNCPDRNWIERLSKIRSHKLAAFPTAFPEETIIRHDSHQIRKAHFPHVNYKSSAVDNVGSLDNVVDNLEDLKISHLSLSDLQHTLIQSYLSLRSESINSDQAEELFTVFFDQQTKELEEGEGLLQEVLDGLSLYVGQFKVFPLPIASLLTWSMTDRRCRFFHRPQ